MFAGSKIPLNLCFATLRGEGMIERVKGVHDSVG
jgi:hypothetical protein